MKHIIAAMLLAGCCLAAADEPVVLTVDGLVYSNVTFGTVTPFAVSVRHSSGLMSVPLAKLPPELQQRFGYDPEKAVKYREAEARSIAKVNQATEENYRRVQREKQDQAEQMANARRKAEQLVQNREGCWNRVDDVIAEGVILRREPPAVTTYSGGVAGIAGPQAVTRALPSSQFILIDHPRRASLAQGDEVKCWMGRDGVFKYGDETIPRYVYICEQNEMPPPKRASH